ncbi:unnamed protein product [Darwinula stevensoni]|uniref:Dynactin subunit 2 n=1 Tax=Darwinula stevensoni TaxID=69355 RepID=A0A7R9A360_9CRUS|nr:unnamed protein product [Darwinula stevensoni]CAG0891075.1 unnamed protein product [Darwinula stevensoni]
MQKSGAVGSYAMEEMKALHHQFIRLRLEEAIGKDALPSLTDPMGSIHKALEQHVESIKQQGQTGKSKGKEIMKGEGKAITYQLQYDPQDTASGEAFLSLERRINELEQILGHKPMDGMVGLLESVKRLDSKVSMLEPAHLDMIESRLLYIDNKLPEIQDKMGASSNDSDGTHGKLNQMMGLLHEVKSLGDVLPPLVNRLVSLHTLHEHALEFSKTLKHVEEMQESLSAELSQTTEMLRTVQGNLEKNVESFKSSVNALDTRFGALKK